MPEGIPISEVRVSELKAESTACKAFELFSLHFQNLFCRVKGRLRARQTEASTYKARA